MKRDIDENLICADKLMKSSDTAKLGCFDCEGCSDCCKGRASLITLDAYDVMILKKGLNYSFLGLLNNNLLTLSVIDGIIYPVLPVKENEDECIFLDDSGRCTIHHIRPGICRMFPLARLWHNDGSFSYFMQPGECSHPSGVKIKISKWLGYENTRAYESAVRIFHDARKDLRADIDRAKSQNENAAVQKAFLERWFINDAPFSD